MSILQYFKPSSTLPIPSETGIRAITTDEANTSVQNELDRQSSKSSRNARSILVSLTKPMRKLVGTLPRMEMEQPGQKIEDVRVDTRLSVIKELEAKLIFSVYDYLHYNPSIIG